MKKTSRADSSSPAHFDFVQFLARHKLDDLGAGHITHIDFVESLCRFFQHRQHAIPFSLQVILPKPADMSRNQLFERSGVDHILPGAGFHFYIGQLFAKAIFQECHIIFSGGKHLIPFNWLAFFFLGFVCMQISLYASNKSFPENQKVE